MKTFVKKSLFFLCAGMACAQVCFASSLGGLEKCVSKHAASLRTTFNLSAAGLFCAKHETVLMNTARAAGVISVLGLGHLLARRFSPKYKNFMNTAYKVGKEKVESVKEFAEGHESASKATGCCIAALALAGLQWKYNIGGGLLQVAQKLSNSKAAQVSLDFLKTNATPKGALKTAAVLTVLYALKMLYDASRNDIEIRLDLNGALTNDEDDIVEPFLSKDKQHKGSVFYEDNGSFVLKDDARDIIKKAFNQVLSRRYKKQVSVSPVRMLVFGLEKAYADSYLNKVVCGLTLGRFGYSGEPSARELLTFSMLSKKGAEKKQSFEEDLSEEDLSEKKSINN